VPLYRIETPTYSAVPPVAQYLGLASIGTFHERRGDQAVLDDGNGTLPAGWARVYGSDGDIKWSGTVAPTFDGSLVGFQAGLDLVGWESASGHHDRAGIFIDHARADGDVRGQALGWNDLSVGGVKLNATSVGGYWTHIGPQGWYLDGVVMASWLDGDATSSRGIGIDIDGIGLAASLEGGYPIRLTPGLTLEPQAQLIWQHFSFDDTADRFSTVSFDDSEALTGRIGLRLQAELAMGGTILRPYAKANLWRGLSGSQDIVFGADTISTETDATTLEVGGGLVAELTKSVSLHVTGDYSTNLGGERQRVVEGNVGLTVNW
jgi:autotransporter family porin